MLIPSPRHTAADLQLWAELEEADRVRGVRLGLVDRSLAAIREFAAVGPCYASVSWGKDSVVLAHLVAISGVVIPLVHLRGVPTGNPDCLRVRDNFLATYPTEYREVEVRYQSVDTAGIDEMQADGERLWLKAIRSQGNRHISGIRADESSGRKIRMRRHGIASEKACAPLGWWTAADVFSYLCVTGLPVHPVYAMLGGGRWNRSQVRTDELMGARGNQFGRREWENEYYPDVIRRLEARR